MTRKYKTSYKSSRGVNRFHVGLSHAEPEERIEKCTFCGGDVEEAPMLRGVCYDCYRSEVIAPVKVEEVSQPDDWQTDYKGRRYSPSQEEATRQWWNEHYSDENVQARLKEQQEAVRF
jgi:NMD protein affecting ribosome stability and mRNA decay